jgi:hypothetical protein
MTVPNVDLTGKAFTERDRKLLDLFLRPDGSSLEQINRAVAKKVAAYSYSGDSARLAERLGGVSWTRGEGGTKRFGIRLPPARQ